MKKVAVVVLFFALIAASVQVAYAQPKVSGLVLQSMTYEFGIEDDATTPEDETETPFTFGETMLRVNFSGDVSPTLGYYGRIQGNAGAGGSSLAVAQAYGTLKNFGVDGLSVNIGRQFIGWSILNNFDGFEWTTIDGIGVNYSADSVGVNAYYRVNDAGEPQGIASDAKIGARLTYDTAMAGLDVSVAGKFEKALEEDGGFGYGFGGSVALAGLGDVYAEVGENAADNNADGLDYIVLGANISALEDATGISAWVEYDVNAESYAFELSRELIDGLTVKFGGEKDDPFAATLELAVSF